MTTPSGWTVPKPECTHDVLLDYGATVTLRRHGNRSGLRLVLSHANGLASDLYYPFWSLFADDCDLVVYDLRNHGWNPAGALEGHNIANFVSDQTRIHEVIDDRWGPKPTVGVFHSVSALAALLSPRSGGEFAARILFDPPLCKPGPGQAAYAAGIRRAVQRASQRTSRFRTKRDYVDLLSVMSFLGGMTRPELELMADTTLRRVPDAEDYELRCPREHEAAVLRDLEHYAFCWDFGDLHCPTRIVGADPAAAGSHFPCSDLSDMPGVDYCFLPEAAHLLPLERPQECAALTYEYVFASAPDRRRGSSSRSPAPQVRARAASYPAR